MIDRLKDILDTDEEETSAMALLSIKIQNINQEFQQNSYEAWKILMKNELHLFEAIEVRKFSLFYLQ